MGQRADMNMQGGEFRLRLATRDDIPRFVGLLALLFTQEADFSPEADRQERGLHLILDQPESGMIFCAEHAQAGVVGMVSILFSVSTAEGGRVAWLEDMIVHPDWRGMGIGRGLLDEAIKKTREAGCLRITLLTDLTNELAMSFYERSGFIRSQMRPMRLKL
jgi:GNAT superfamily N-acetyltransferase